MLEQNRHWLLSAAMMVFMTAGSTVHAETKLPVFADNFDTVGLLAENFKLTPVSAWHMQDGRLVASSSGSAGALLKSSLPEDCEVVVDITPLDVTNGFAGIIVHGINFLLRPGGYWCPYRVQGMERALGASIKADVTENQKYQFRIVSRQVNGAIMFSWFVNDAKVAEFIEAGKLEGGGVSFLVNKMPAAYDNLVVSGLVHGEVSANLLPNSSFEYAQDGYPLNWKLGDPTAMLNVYDSIEPFWQSWALEHEKANVRSGSTSLKLESNGDSLGRSVQSHQAGITVNHPVTGSIHIKSDTDDLPITITLWETYGKAHTRKFTVGKQWTRCEMVVTNPAKNSIRIGVAVQAKGTIWLDDAQIELGESASTYEPSVLDSGFTVSSKETINFPKQIRLKRFVAGPSIDGTIEAAWEKMAKTDQFLIKGKTAPANKTEAYLGCDAENLYLAFRCYSDDLGKLRATGQDNGAIWTDDCIEIFIDPALSRSRYLHLGFNSNGAKAGFNGNKQARTDTWDVKTSLNRGRKCWEAEVRLPLNMLGLTRTTGNEWGLNLCRNETSKAEQSCTALIPRANFHDVAYYGSVVWPKRTLEAFAMDVSDVRLSEAVEADNLIVSGMVWGGSGVDKTPSIQFFTNDQPVTERKVLALSRDNAAEFSLLCKPGLGKKDTTDLVGKVVSSKGELVNQFEQMVKLGKRIDAYTQRNYYMNEENAVLIVDLTIPPQADIRGVITVTDKDNKILWRSELTSLKRAMRIDVPIKSMPVGNHELQFELKQGARLLASASSPLLKRAYEKNGTQIDLERRCIIVDGRPFLVIAPLIHMFSHSQEYIRRVARHWADAGFKTIMVVKNSNHADFKKSFDDMLAASEEYGVKTILWPGYDLQHEAGAEFDRVARPFVNAPSLIAWLPVDEPELSSTPMADRVVDCIKTFRQKDPYHPVYMNNSILGIASRYADLTTDILSIDHYVTKLDGEHKVADVLSQVAVMTRAGEQERKPSWMFLSGNNLYNHVREPSVGEQVAQSYGTIITGCSGMYYFMGQPSCKRHWETLKQINKELLSLGDVIFSLAETAPAAINASTVVLMTRRLGDSTYIISVNVEDKRTDVVITCPAGVKTTGPAEVLFEGRELDVKDGRFSDVYAPHQRHVYKIPIN